MMGLSCLITTAIHIKGGNPISNNCYFANANKLEACNFSFSKKAAQLSHERERERVTPFNSLQQYISLQFCIELIFEPKSKREKEF